MVRGVFCGQQTSVRWLRSLDHVQALYLMVPIASGFSPSKADPYGSEQIRETIRVKRGLERLLQGALPQRNWLDSLQLGPDPKGSPGLAKSEVLLHRQSTTHGDLAGT